MLSIKYLAIIASLTQVTLTSPINVKPWKSGEILSHEQFLYGAFEANMTTSSGDGAISAFFLLKENSWLPGKAWQELDFEVFGKSDGLTYQTQIMTPGDPRTQNLVEHEASNSLHENYHTYRIEWTPDYLAFYLDGALVRKETDAEIYQQFLDATKVRPMPIRLSLWAGFSDWSGQIDPDKPPTPMIIDWVRYYSYQESSGAFKLVWEDQFDEFDWDRWQKANWTFEYAVNDFIPDNAYVENNRLNLVFSR